jgi:uncharacterized protein DUF4190
MTQITDHPAPPTYPYPYQPYPAVQRTNGLAIASLVLGIVWLYWVGSLLAIIFGTVALHQIEQSGGALGGRGMAIAGVVLGWVGFATFAIMVIVIAVSAAGSSTSGY